ncbi:hypothetical protein [Sulfuriferula sp.]|uniref:hypothetical protein n=1 Tax=Sulfuriferula sp. TaxID=2025307 RepID=UPI00272EED12|nr:hypothetical protein [Sulfuriferula sp.]MDP2024631.1 hypothetical protein [Sulfuriferula sp.]
MPAPSARLNAAPPIGLVRLLFGVICLTNALLHLDPAYQARFLARLAADSAGRTPSAYWCFCS